MDCIHCVECVANTRFICGHKAYCRKCIHKYRYEKCPFCMTPIDHFYLCDNEQQFLLNYTPRNSKHNIYQLTTFEQLLSSIRLSFNTSYRLYGEIVYIIPIAYVSRILNNLLIFIIMGYLHNNANLIGLGTIRLTTSSDLFISIRRFQFHNARGENSKYIYLCKIMVISLLHFYYWVASLCSCTMSIDLLMIMDLLSICASLICKFRIDAHIVLNQNTIVSVIFYWKIIYNIIREARSN